LSATIWPRLDSASLVLGLAFGGKFGRLPVLGLFGEILGFTAQSAALAANCSL
jgi:hypothetical protein